MTLESDLAVAFVLVGVVLLLIEAAQPGAFLLVPATIVIAIGFMGLLYPNLLFSIWSPLIAVILFAPMTYLTIKLYQRIAPPAPPETTVATSLIGQKGTVVKTVVPNNLKGKVRVANDTWSATASIVIDEGKNVVVKGSEGVHVIVEEIAE